MSIVKTPPPSANNAVDSYINKNQKSTDSVDAERDKFMTLLITQLKNQDPLNPLDNAAVTSQLAQLSTVSGINKLNSTLETLRADQQSSQSVAATNLIGRGVLAPGKAVSLAVTVKAEEAKDGKPEVKEVRGAVFGFALEKDASEVSVEVVDKSGKTVRTITTPSVPAGNWPLYWNGDTDVEGVQAPVGEYTIKVTAKNGGSEIKEVTPLTYGVVASVSTTGAGGLQLNVPAIGKLTMADIKEVL